MTQNDAVKLHKCAYCQYSSKRNYDIKRHQNAKHKVEFIIDCDKIRNGQNVSPIGQNVSPIGQNVSPCNLFCTKCNKIYKTEKNLKNHIQKCRGVDELTCSKCMTSFTTRAAKSKHIKNNKCKAKSIIHARSPNVQNITNNISINNTTNIDKQYNIYVNNFGNERIDHISKEEICKMLTSGINTIPLYIEKKHFDKDFPENNNITFTNENKCKVKENDKWLEKDLKFLSNKLIEDNTEILLLHFDENKVEIAEKIGDIDIVDRIEDKLIVIYNKSNSNKYNQVMTKIKDLIKNFQMV